MENPTTTKKPVSKKPVQVPNTPTSQSASASTRRYMQVAGIIIAVVVLVGGYLIYYLANKYTQISNVNKAQDKLLTALQANQKSLKELAPNYEAITTKNETGISDADLILRAVPTTQNYESLLAMLEKMGLESGVKVSSISQTGSTATGTDATSGATASSSTEATPFTFTVNVEGSYAAIIEFLKKTESSARVINFNSMSLNGKSSSINANLTMTTFFKPNADIESKQEPLR
jgi:Tfp pilus assembly protein PilO